MSYRTELLDDPMEKVSPYTSSFPYTSNKAVSTPAPDSLNSYYNSHNGDAFTGGGGEQIIGDANGTWLTGKTTLRASAALSANRVVTLPLAASFRSGARIIYIDSVTDPASTFIRSFGANGSDTVDGSSTYYLFAGPGTVELESDGVSAWTPVHDTGSIITLRDRTSPSRQGHFNLSGVTLGRDSEMVWPDLATWNPGIKAITTPASGSSNSATPGTLIVQLTAAAGNKFISWVATGRHGSAAGVQLKVIVTYFDADSDNVTTTASSQAGLIITPAGIMDVTGAGLIVSFKAKHVTDIRLETAGTSTGIRSGTISVLEVPI